MKPFLVLLLGLSAMPSFADADDVKALEQAQRALNTAYLKQDAETIKRLTGEDLIVVTSLGQRENREQQLKGLPELKLTEYVTDNVKVAMPAKDTAIVTFQSAIKGTFKGKAFSPRLTVVTVWVRRDGTWLEVFYQASPLDAK